MQFNNKAAQKRSLLMGKKSIHGGVKFPCKQCDHKATQKGSLSTHITESAFLGLEKSFFICI